MQLTITPSTVQTITLRHYQQQVIAETHDAIAQGATRPLVVAATGSGKTCIMAKLLQDFTSQGLRCLVLVHLDCLVPQTAEKLEAFGVAHGFIKAGYSEDREAPVQIASVQTLPRRHWWKEHTFDVLILDECHKTGWAGITQRLLTEHYPDSICVGFTATPWRLSKHEEMGDVFNALISAPLPVDLMDMCYLVRPRYYGLAEADLVEVRTVAGDFAEADLETVCNRPELVNKLVDEYQRISPGKRAIAFGVNVAHARAIAQAFTQAGIPAAAVDGSTPIPERNRIYNKLASGELLMLSGCAVFCEGFDVPAVEVCLMARPTKSRALYYQQIGRVLRPSPGKDSAIILDQAGNVRRFGFVEDLSHPELTLGEPKHGAGEMPVKDCPMGIPNIFNQVGCGALVRMFEPKCPECGFIFYRPKAKQTGQLVEMAVGAPKPAPPPVPHQTEIDALIAQQQRCGYKPGWVGFRVLDIPNVTQADLRYAAAKLGFKPGWAYHKWQELQQKRAEAVAV